jgi:hypothetical protein
MTTKAPLLVLFALILAACNGEIYLRDGLTDGDTFYLADRATMDNDPGYQSWVTYSLARSTCQLRIGGDNPARSSSFDCELTSRRLLLESWHEKRREDPGITDPYLDELAIIGDAEFLDEYVAATFRKRHWTYPDNLEMNRYRRWMKTALPDHDPVTRITGSWNYAKNISAN